MIHIEELRLRVPGVSEKISQRLGRDIAQYLSERMESGAPDRRIGSLHIRVDLKEGVSHKQMVQSIGDQLLTNLSKVQNTHE